jgi:hypothetical protein
MISNKFDGIEAAIANSILKSILTNTIKKYDGKPKEIISQSLLEFNELIENNKPAILTNPMFTVLLVFHDCERKDIRILGSDLIIFIHTLEKPEDQFQHPVFQSYNLSLDKELNFKEPCRVMAFSPSAFKNSQPQEILTTLNATNLQNKTSAVEQLVKEIFHKIQDLLIVELTFF